MTAISAVDRDERTVAVENASYRWAYLFISFGLLTLIAYRSFVHHESNWDLMAIVVVGGLLSAAFQWFNKILSARWAATCLVTIVAAGALAAITVWIR